VRIVAALGGNALARRGEALDVTTQRANVARAAAALATLARSHQLVVTHGNGPQVGLLALQSEACAETPPYPLDVLDAESAGMIGYLIEQALRAQLPGRDVATLLTQVQVDPADPAFDHPVKAIGPGCDEAQADRLKGERGWRFVRDGSRYRRAVASPEPLRVLELHAIELLLDAGAIVVCAGGGGIPVCLDEGGAIRGVEAVIDKDLASALLARHLHADALLLLTDVDAVLWDGAPLREITPQALRGMQFEAGTMQPKVEAACRFVESGGRFAGIGRLENAAALLAGASGTRVLKIVPGRSF
jgi:carbamate kinase